MDVAVDEIRAQIERLIRGKAFESSEGHRRLLQYLADRTSNRGAAVPRDRHPGRKNRRPCENQLGFGSLRHACAIFDDEATIAVNGFHGHDRLQSN
jgi:hypothetical protein